MSSLDLAAGPEVDAALAKTEALLAAAVGDPSLIPNDAFQRLFEKIIKIYGAKAEQGFRRPFPSKSTMVGADEAMVVATDLLHAVNVQVFELSMWQAMTGNCIDPSHRTNPAD